MKLKNNAAPQIFYCNKSDGAAIYEGIAYMAYGVNDTKTGTEE